MYELIKKRFWIFWTIIVVILLILFTRNLDAQVYVPIQQEEPINTTVYDNGYLITCGVDSVFIYKNLTYGMRGDTLMILMRKQK